METEENTISTNSIMNTITEQAAQLDTTMEFLQPDIIEDTIEETITLTK